MHPDNYEVICNICDLRSLRQYAVDAYNVAISNGISEEKAFTIAVEEAYKLNGDVIEVIPPQEGANKEYLCRLKNGNVADLQHLLDKDK